MRTIGFLLTALALSAAPLGAQQFGPAPDAATQRELLALREAAWRTWFSNDQEGFRRVVPDELVGLSWSGGPWEDRSQTMAQMQEFAKSGMTLKSLEFPRNVFQHYGDVVILSPPSGWRSAAPRDSSTRRQGALPRSSCADLGAGSTPGGTLTP
jgi:hypothetical protein